jgi:hypothetical protein
MGEKIIGVAAGTVNLTVMPSVESWVMGMVSEGVLK